MSRTPTSDEPKLLPDSTQAAAAPLAPVRDGAPRDAATAENAPRITAPRDATPAALPRSAPARQMADLPRDELSHLAEEFGLDPTQYKTNQHLVAALHDRRQLIASLDREAMLDVIRWGRRPVTQTANQEQIAQEIARIGSMRFAGLSQRGLVVLARLRGVPANDGDEVPQLIARLKKREGLFSRISRKRRAMLGSMVARIIGESADDEYQFLPPPAGSGPAGASRTSGPIPTIREDIEEAGLVGGITNRIKKTADAYLNQKLDEIEARIDRKLDEIDRRLGDWRDKEIANRIRILKITLWASVIVGIFSLIYSYVKVYFFPH